MFRPVKHTALVIGQAPSVDTICHPVCTRSLSELFLPILFNNVNC